jgi:tRNA A22 N-methylase
MGEKTVDLLLPPGRSAGHLRRYAAVGLTYAIELENICATEEWLYGGGEEDGRPRRGIGRN